MKQVLAWILVCVLMFGLAACVSVEPEQQPSGTKPAQMQNGSESKETENEPAQTVTFEEIVVLDNEHCTIKITGIDEDFLWGYSLKVYLENKTAEKTLMYSVRSASINGVDTDPLFAQEVAPGKKSNDSISFSDSTLEENDIGNYTDIFLDFHVYDSENFMGDDLGEATVHVYPYGEESATKYIREAESTDTVLVDNDKVKVIITDYDPDSLWGYSANLYIVNKTDKTVMVSIEESSVNGYMIDPFYATTVIPGCSKFSSVSWSSTEMETNGITEVEEIEFVLRVYDENDWMAEDFANEAITLNP